MCQASKMRGRGRAQEVGTQGSTAPGAGKQATCRNSAAPANMWRCWGATFHQNLTLPVGVHFVPAYGQEDMLLRLAAQLEAAQPWTTKRPPVCV